MLYATDAAWTLTTLIDDKTPWLASSIVYHDRTAARETEIKLRLFKQNGGTLHLCHDIETVSL